jgi:hypothetical protein
MSTTKLNRLLLPIAVASAFAAGTAQASDSVDVTVNATIVGVCKFFTSSPVINITNTGTGSNIDPSAAGPASGNVNITYRCSNGTSPTFTVPATATVTCTTSGTCGSSTMVPTVSATNGGAGTGMGSGKDKTLNVVAQITQANYENSPVGSYSGTMTVSVNP